MTEAEWLGGNDVKRMIEAAGVRCGERRLRLFSVGCCVRLWAFLDAPVREAIVTAEGYADGLVGEDQLTTACTATTDLHEATRRRFPPPVDGWTSDRAMAGPAVAIYTTSRDRALMLLVPECMRRLRAAITAFDSTCTPIGRQDHGSAAIAQRAAEAEADEGEGQAVLARDILGNPFRPVTLLPEWRTSSVLALAQQMYDSRDFCAMPILADALQDADCRDEAILNHCRDTSLTHARGCWVVDLLLGKE